MIVFSAWVTSNMFFLLSSPAPPPTWKIDLVLGRLYNPKAVDPVIKEIVPIPLAWEYEPNDIV
jgi:hypothetical protein